MRVSTDEQKQQGTIENQRAVLTRYLDLHGIAPLDWYQDEAVSGTVRFADRPDVARLLADVRAGHVQTVLVRRLDRLGRNAREILNAVHELEQAGGRLISLKENVDTRTSAGRFFLTVLAGVSELEKDLIQERTDDGTAHRLESNAWMGGRAPYGYRVEGKKRDARLVINDVVDSGSGYSELDVLRLAWHLVVEEDWSEERVCDYLETLAIPTRRAALEGTSQQEYHWSPAVLWRALTSYTYTGTRTFRAKDGTLHSHPIPAIFRHARRGAGIAPIAMRASTANISSMASCAAPSAAPPM
jgi:site-specific DNA recombinase